MKKSRRVKKEPNDYPKTSVRIPQAYLQRMARLRSEVPGMSFGRIIVQALHDRLPAIEQRHGIKKAAA